MSRQPGTTHHRSAPDFPALALPSRANPELRNFVRESNRIEGIHRPPLQREIGAHVRFIALDTFGISDLETFVGTIAPGHLLRAHQGLNVRVGNHIAPPGGIEISQRLGDLISAAGAHLGPIGDPYWTHQAYEHLHPFTDGNGRSGRVLWLWMMLREGRDPWAMRRGFLHTFYYQSLSAQRQWQPASKAAAQVDGESSRDGPLPPTKGIPQ